jgi:hypothetical protein
MTDVHFCVLISDVSAEAFTNYKQDPSIISVSDIKSQGQTACHEEQKTCKEESMNVMRECDV